MQTLRNRLTAILTGRDAARVEPGWSGLRSGLDVPADRDDVANAYKLFLGRPAESEVVLSEKVGSPRRDLPRVFIGSEEFRTVVYPFILAGQPGALFASSLRAEMKMWAAGLFLSATVDECELADAQDTAPLLALCLRAPIIGGIVDEIFGTGSASALADRAAIISPPRLKASTSRQDLENCYQLFLQRLPESERVVAERPDTILAESVCDFLSSPEFAAKVGYPAADGLAIEAIASDALRKWAVHSLKIADAETLDPSSIIAAAIDQPAIAASLQQRKLSWVPSNVVRGLTAAIRGGQNTRSVNDHLVAIGRNVEIVASNDMELVRSGPLVQFSNDDPWVIFKPTGVSVESDLIALRLRATMDGLANHGRLYLNYGNGFSEDSSLPLTPDLDGFHRAILAAPRRLTAVRWDPCSMSGTASVSLIEATPLTAEEYFSREIGSTDESSAATILTRFAMEASRRPQDPLSIALSRTLSPVVDTDYANWILRNELQGETGRRQLTEAVTKLADRPVISIVVPVYNTSADALSAMIASVQAQAYPHWELCIADDASTKPHVHEILARAADKDDRVKVFYRPINGHICAASNSALGLVSGRYVAMLDHDDTLAPQALLAVAQYLERHPDAGLIYSDEDKLDERGQRFDPYFKPDYSPELLLAQNYMNHLTVIRTDLVRELGGWRAGFEGSQDHDLVFRVVEKLGRHQVGHIPQVLYHWRATTGSTALENEQKSYVLHAGEKAVRDHLARTGRAAHVEVMTHVHHYRVRHDLPDPQPFVSLIIPTRDKAEVLRLAVDSILDRSTYRNYEILIVDNGSIESETLSYFKTLEKHDSIRVLPYPQPFNYSRINNFAAPHAKGSIIGLVNNDVEVITPDWIEEMASWAVQKDIGCVGAKLYYSDMSIQHAGVIVGLGGCAGHSHKYFPQESAGYFNRLHIHQNYSAVTAACLFVRREVFEEVGGLDEQLAVAFNDVDFCLRVREAGYRNVFTPFAELFHHESISRGAEDTPEKMARAASEVRFMKERWSDLLQSDPFYSPNLPYDREDFGINISMQRY